MNKSQTSEVSNSNVVIIKKVSTRSLHQSLAIYDHPQGSPSGCDTSATCSNLHSTVTVYEDQGSFSKSKKWKKVSNIFKSIVYLKNHNTTPLESSDQFDEDLEDYKSRLFENTVKSRNSSRFGTCNEENRKEEDIKETFVKAMISQKINNNEASKENARKDIYELILNSDNDRKALKQIETIFKYNPDRSIIKPESPKFVFNQPMKNGRNLFYIACFEGKEDIVRYFLKKRLDAKIKSDIGDGYKESPLECSCRWGYLKIVKLLLENVIYSSEEISDCLKIEGISQQIIQLLKQQLKKCKRREGTFCC